MDPATILALVLSGGKVLAGLVAAYETVQRGGTLSEEQMAVIRGEQAAAQARNDAALSGALGETGNSPTAAA